MLSDQLDGQDAAMDTISLAEAKARLSELVARAAEGETVQITRRGKPVAQITPIQKRRKPIDIALLRSVTDSMPMQPETAGEFIRRMRDDERY
jgi:prevent-host-death family protein